MEQYYSYGIPYLDELTGGILLGDNVVWVVEPGTYSECFSERFLTVEEEHLSRKIYVSFDFPPQKIYNRFRDLSSGEDFVLVDAFTFGKGKGDEFFQSFYESDASKSGRFRVHSIQDLRKPDEFIATMREIQGEFEEGLLCKYVFDSLTGMQELWGDKDTLNFFTYTCPKLYEQKALAYWPLAREAHSRAFLANVSHITQLVISLSFQNNSTCVARFLKVEGRPSKLLNQTHCYVYQDREIAFSETIDESASESSPDGLEWLQREGSARQDSSFLRNKYPIKIGGRIREFRLERKLTQVELARILGVTPSALSQIESNQSLPSLQLLVNIARFFGKSLDSFFASATPPSGTSKQIP